METQQIIELGFGLLFAAYAYIFSTVNRRIEEIENKNCNPANCRTRFEKLEKRQDETDTKHTEILVKLAKIETILEEMSKKKR